MKISKVIIMLFIAIDVIVFIWLLTHGKTIALLQPKGLIASQESRLIVTAVSIMLCIIVPSVLLLFFVAWKYRASNTKAKYEPDLKHSKLFELMWWVVPSIVILIIATLLWKNTHKLDPYKSLDSTVKPITIQVVALRWKWLFIYPEQDIATVNFIQFPAHTPVNFELTADAPMNSFWIPQLGGQIYAMTGMSTKLHLIANEPGEYRGSAAEISGPGFAGMRFIAKASSDSEFDAWVTSVKTSSEILDMTEYERLVAPTENVKPMFYSSTEQNLYNKIIQKFMPEDDMNMEGMH